MWPWATWLSQRVPAQPALFTTMDITTDGFGFMLASAITWVPFTYTVQARYLVFNQIELGPVYTALIAGVNLLGYYIFRAANLEKNDFRNGKNPKSSVTLAFLYGIVES